MEHHHLHFNGQEHYEEHRHHQIPYHPHHQPEQQELEEWHQQLDLEHHIRHCTCSCNHMGYGNYWSYKVRTTTLRGRLSRFYRKPNPVIRANSMQTVLCAAARTSRGSWLLSLLDFAVCSRDLITRHKTIPFLFPYQPNASLRSKDVNHFGRQSWFFFLSPPPPPRPFPFANGSEM